MYKINPRLKMEIRYSEYAKMYNKFDFLIHLDNKSIDTMILLKKPRNFKKCMKQLLIKTHFYKNTYLHFKTNVQNTTVKKQPNQSLFTFFRNQNLIEVLFLTVSIALRIYSYLVSTDIWLFCRTIVFVSQRN